MPPYRRALIVGLNTYHLTGNDLQGSVADAEAMAERLSKHANDDPNYECRVFLDRTDTTGSVTRAALREALSILFAPDFQGDILFYFSGHGVLTTTGGVLMTQDGKPGDWGILMQEVVSFANKAKARSVTIILDCCHGGDMGNVQVPDGQDGQGSFALLREDLTLIGASSPVQLAVEAGGQGLFTSAVIDALDGGAADHMGWVTGASIYAYVDRRFGAWEQRPIYKSHATYVPVIRECQPLIDKLKLRELVKHFPSGDYQFRLDPDYEPEDENGNVHQPVNDEKVAVAQLFKEYRDAGLLRPSIKGEQLYWTARHGNTVELTPRGWEYWWLVSKDKL